MLWLTLCFFSLSIAFLFHHRFFKDVWEQVDFLTDRIKELENEIDLLNKELANYRELETKVDELTVAVADESQIRLVGAELNKVKADVDGLRKRLDDEYRRRARLADVLGERDNPFRDVASGNALEAIDAGVEDYPREA